MIVSALIYFHPGHSTRRNSLTRPLPASTALLHHDEEDMLGFSLSRGK